MKRILFAILLAAMSGAVLQAQPSDLPTPCEDRIRDIRTASNSTERAIAIQAALDVRRNPACFASLLAMKEAYAGDYAALLRSFEVKRTDKQAGSSTGTGGTTNLISKGVTARVISFAAEYGALTESVNKQVVTVQGSLDGLPKALIRHNLVEYCPPGETSAAGCIASPLLRALGRFSYGVSFDTSASAQTVSGAPSGQQQGGAQPVVFTADHHQISAISGRIVLWNARDDTSKAYQQAWAKALKNAETLKTAANDLLGKMGTFLASAVLPAPLLPQYERQLKIAADDLQSAANGAVRERWKAQVFGNLLPFLQSQPGVANQAEQFLQARGNYRFEEDQFVDTVAQKPVLAVEYDHNSPSGQKATSAVRLIFDKGFPNKWALTANGAVTLYDAKPAAAIPGSGRLRDTQIGLQLQKDLGSVPGLGPAALSWAYYFQYQNSANILKVTPGKPLPGISFIGLPENAAEVFTQKGRLHVGQIKLALGTGESNVRFPLALSWSNRTELVSKPNWRAQVGITYDFDSVFTK